MPDRKKQAKTCLQFHARTFNLPLSPCRILCDANFVFHFLQSKLGDSRESLERTLQTLIPNKVTLHCVEASLNETLALAEEQALENKALLFKTLELLRGMDKLTVGGDAVASFRMAPGEAIRKLTGSQNNRHGFVVATMDEELKQSLRQLVGVPILSFSRVVLMLEPPSEASKRFWKEMEEKKKGVGKEERKRLHEESVSLGKRARLEEEKNESSSSSLKKSKQSNYRDNKNPNHQQTKKMKSVTAKLKASKKKRMKKKGKSKS